MDGGSLSGLPRPVWTLYLASLVNRFGNSAVVFLALRMHAVGLGAGVVLTAYGVGGVGASLLGGYLADRWPRQWVIAGSAIPAAIGFLALGGVRDYSTAVALALLTGLTAEMYRPAANALVADLVEPERRVGAYVGYRLFTNVGFAVGPMVAGLLGGGDSPTVFVIAAFCCLGYAALVLFGVPSDKPAAAAGQHHGNAFPLIVRDRRFLLFLVGSFLAMFLLIQYQSTFALFTRDIGRTSQEFGLLVGANGLLVVLLSVPLAAATAPWRSGTALAVGFALTGLGFGLDTVATGFGPLLLAVAVSTAGEVVFMPRSTSYVVEVAPAAMRARYLSALEGAWSVAMVASPGLGIALYSVLGTGFWPVCAAVGVLAALTVLSGRTGPRLPAQEGASLADR
ncbi:MFS transporter [Actinokineospora enzanensis]|uniref:MFS transporter n=1 Tax=Actinokineospora enzanensis TaxID=155975 RepID=UPI00037681A2|nr:MFS transporter [Actinokineospora enzanensis]